MSKIALATAVVALTAAVPLTMGRAEAYLLPGAEPPWGTTTTTETKPVPTPAATPATRPPRTSVESGTTTPIQGTTTPIQAVFLRSGPSTGSPVIGRLQPGMAVQVIASGNYGWMQVETPAGSGWTYGSYLAPAGSTVVVQHPAAPQEIIAP
jgi:hypothetical protein